MSRKGDKSIIPQACSRKRAAFIAILFCHGKEANGIYLHSAYRCAKTQVRTAVTVYCLSLFDVIVVTMCTYKCS